MLIRMGRNTFPLWGKWATPRVADGLVGGPAGRCQEPPFPALQLSWLGCYKIAMCKTGAAKQIDKPSPAAVYLTFLHTISWSALAVGIAPGLSLLIRFHPFRVPERQGLHSATSQPRPWFLPPSLDLRE